MVSKPENCADETRRDISDIKVTLASINEKMATKDDIHKIDNRLIAVETKVAGLPTLAKIATLIGLFAAIIPLCLGLLKHLSLIYIFL